MITGRLLGLDVGSKRIGVAVSDELGMLASPLVMVLRGRNDRAEFSKLVNDFKPEKLIVGLPTGLSGREGPQAAETRSYADALATHLQLPIEYWDERLSSTVAERTLIEAGVRREQRKEKIDAMAAAVMLQGYLDRQRFRTRHGR
jgi:putative Holliday junction resolvase